MPQVRRFIAVAVICIMNTCAARLALAANNDFVIVPGVRIGPLKLPATEADVLKAFPLHAVPVEIDMPEGGLERGTALYPCDPDSIARLHYRNDHGRRLVISIDVERNFPSVSGRCSEPAMLTSPDPLLKGQLPGDTLDTSQYDWKRRGDVEDSKLPPLAMRASDKWPPPSSTWHLENGIHLGVGVETLERLNGGPFDIKGPEGDGDWRH